MNNSVFDPAPLVPLVLRQRTWQPTDFVRLTYNSHVWGFIHLDLAQSLGHAGLITKTTPHSPNAAQLILPPCSPNETTEIFEMQLDAAVEHLIAQGLVNEDHYAPEDRDYVGIDFDPTLEPAKLARHYASSFGLVIKGMATLLHNNGGIWLSQRGPDVYYPNILEHSSGGLVTFGTKILDTAQHELADELILPIGLETKLCSYSRSIMCFQPSARRLTRLMNYHFHLPLPNNITPQANEAPDVKHLVHYTHTALYKKIIAAPADFTPYAINSVVDFWLQHGFLDMGSQSFNALHNALYMPFDGAK